MRIFIESTEPLLFRTGRPFQAGENNFAETLFPPTPETLQGALRAMIAAQWGNAYPNNKRTTDELFSDPDLVNLIGKRDGDHNVYERFRITGSTLGHIDRKSGRVSRLFPAPTHIIQVSLYEGKAKKTEMVRLIPRPLSTEWSNHPEGKHLPFPDLGTRKTAGKSEPLGGWLTPLGLQRALSKTGFPQKEEKDRDEDICLVSSDEIFQRESRLGIGINNRTKTSREGYLYQVQMIRMQENYGFVVDIELGEKSYGASALPPSKETRSGTLETPPELAFLKEGWMTIGGEQRAVYFKVLKPEEIVAEPGIHQDEPGNLLYFATPAYFANGWLPANTTLFPAEPISAAINRYQPIGGWLLSPGSADGMSKRVRRCVQAGSVYYFDRSVKVEQALTEYGWQIGYGIAYTGEY